MNSIIFSYGFICTTGILLAAPDSWHGLLHICAVFFVFKKALAKSYYSKLSSWL